MRYEVEILSPLHIGDGTSKRGLDYFIANNKVNYISTQEFSKIPVDLQIKFINEYDMNQRLNLTSFLGSQTKSLEPAYSIRLSLGSMRGDEEIISFVKTNKKPFIPGSEIKGAIRTAILYNFLKNTPEKLDGLVQELTMFKHNLTKLLTDYKNAQKAVREMGKKLGTYKENCMKEKCKPLMDLMKKECKDCKHFDKESRGLTPEGLLALKKGKPDSLYCKFVKDKEPQGCKKNLISRAIRGEFDSVYRFNCKICSFFQNRDIRAEYSTSHDQYFKQLKANRETTHKKWREEQERVSEFLNEQIEKYEKKFFNYVLDDIKTSLFRYLIITDSNQLSYEHTSVCEERITHRDPGIEGKLHKFIKEYVSPSSKTNIEIIIQKEKSSILFGEDKKELDIDFIKKACNQFALDKINSEINYFMSNDFKNRKELNTVREFYKGLKEKITKEPQNIFLRLGAGQGLLSITIDLLFKDKPFYKTLIANLKEKRDGNNLHGIYPASRRVVDIGNGYLPPGWICLKEAKQ